MIAPLSPGQPGFSAPLRSSGSPSESEQDGFKPRGDEELTRDLQARILLAHINFEMQRGSGQLPPLVEEASEASVPQRGHSSTGMLQDARLDMKAGEMQGPLTSAELWGGYLIPKHNPWR
jgi:hypothetical protein